MWKLVCRRSSLQSIEPRESISRILTVCFVCHIRPAIVDRKLDWKAEAKIPKATDASKHKAGGGNVEICMKHTDSAYSRRIGTGE